MALNELNHALLPTVGHSFLVHETPPIARNFLPFPTTNLAHPLDPFMNDPQSNGTSSPILWRVHGPTPHNWRCFGLHVARRCYLLIEYIILLAIALYWRLLSSSHHNHYRDSYSGALELQSWRLPIQIKPDYAHSDPIPIPLPRSAFHRIESKWQSMAESISVYTKRPQQPRTSHSTYHLMTLSRIAPHLPDHHSRAHGRPIPNPSNLASISTMHLHWFQWMRFWRTKHSIHSCNEWYVKSPWYSSAFLRSFRMIIIIIT